MEEEDLEFYKNIIKNSEYDITSEMMDEYLGFCLNEVGKNILYCYNIELPVKVVISEIFKRALIKRWNQLHRHNRKCFRVEYDDTVFKRFKVYTSKD